MKTKRITFLAVFIFINFSIVKGLDFLQTDTSIYRDITKTISVQEFEVIKNYILESGDRETYSQMYNDNPHYLFNGFDTFLNPEIGQGNPTCDPKISDFNEIVIRDQKANSQYYEIHIVRKGDIENPLIHYYEGMSEEKVYLLNLYKYDIDTMELRTNGYIKSMKSQISTEVFSFVLQEKDDLFLYPNPSFEKLSINIQSSITGIFHIEIIDIHGKTMLLQNVNSLNGIYNSTINISQLPAGLYICRLKSTNKVFVEKFLKSK